MLVVSDTSPLRALQAVDRVSLIQQLYGNVLIPPAVAAELGVDATPIGALRVADFPFLIVRAPSDSRVVARLRTEVDQGEAEALALAIEVHADAVLIDESAGRRVAARLGLLSVGALAVLIQAKRQGLVERVAPLLDILAERIQFRVADQVRRRVLEDAGESQ